MTVFHFIKYFLELCLKRQNTKMIIIIIRKFFWLIIKKIDLDTKIYKKKGRMSISFPFVKVFFLLAFLFRPSNSYGTFCSYSIKVVTNTFIITHY